MTARTATANLVLGLCLTALSGVALADPVGKGEPAAPTQGDSAPSPTAVEDIIVTATKRAENIQDVPVAVQAIGGAQVRQLNITSLGELIKLSPSFNFAPNYTPRTQATFIRGIGTYTTSDAIEPSVGIVVDGVALGRQGMAYIDPFDVSQIEVLRGPQGTLFGKNASAGVVSIDTQAPTSTPELAARALFGNQNEQQYGISVGGELAPGVATRLTAYYNQRDGEITDTFLNRAVDGTKNYGFRGKVKFDVGAADVTFIADYNRADANCCAWIFSSDGGPGTFRDLLTAYGITAGPNNYQIGADLLPLSQSTSGGVSMTVHLPLGNEQLTSITAFRGWHTNEVSDVDQLPVQLANSYNMSRQYQLSEELRLSNSGTSAWAHTLGVYYFHYVINDDATIEFPAAGGLFGPLGDVQTRALQRLTYDNGAVFGELTHTFPDDTTKLRAGVRVTVESVGADISRTDNIEFVPSFAAYTQHDSNTNVGESFVVALQHNFTPRLMTYAQVSRGFKGAAYDLPGPSDATPSPLVSHRVAPEIAMNYEAGVRSQLFDRTLTLNVTAFYETFQNYQSTSFDAAADVFRLSNIGSLHSAGAEVEFSWQPTRAFTIGGGVTFVDARYDDNKNGECQYTFFHEGLCTQAAPGTYIIDLTGRRIYYAPKWTLAINSRYDLRTLPGPFNAYASANYSYRSSTAAEPSLDPATYIQAYGLLDARLGLTTKDGKYELAVFGRNLTDEHYFGTHFFATLFGGLSAGNDATAAFQGQRRSYGLELVAKF